MTSVVEAGLSFALNQARAQHGAVVRVGAASHALKEAQPANLKCTGHGVWLRASSHCLLICKLAGTMMNCTSEDPCSQGCEAVGPKPQLTLTSQDPASTPTTIANGLAMASSNNVEIQKTREFASLKLSALSSVLLTSASSMATGMIFRVCRLS